jgi:hypothetical protein
MSQNTKWLLLPFWIPCYPSSWCNTAAMLSLPNVIVLTMPARSLRERSRPSTRPSSATPCYGRSVSSSAINARSQSKSLDRINKTQTPKVLPVLYEDSSDIIVPSPSPYSSSPKNKMGARQKCHHAPCFAWTVCLRCRLLRLVGAPPKTLLILPWRSI